MFWFVSLILLTFMKSSAECQNMGYIRSAGSLGGSVVWLEVRNLQVSLGITGQSVDYKAVWRFQVILRVMYNYGLPVSLGLQVRLWAVCQTVSYRSGSAGGGGRCPQHAGACHWTRNGQCSLFSCPCMNLKQNEAQRARAESTHKGVNQRSRYVTQQQQRPESPTVLHRS